MKIYNKYFASSKLADQWIIFCHKCKCQIIEEYAYSILSDRDDAGFMRLCKDCYLMESIKE